MAIKKKYIDMIVAELKSPLTQEVEIQSSFEGMVIKIKQVMPVEYFGTQEMRKELDTDVSTER